MTTRRDVLHAGGGALLQPLAAWAQPVGPVRRIGVLSPGAAATEAASPWRAVFVEMLQRAGFEPGRNLAVEVRYAEGQVERLPELAQELVQLKVELIAAVQNDAVAAARHATRNVRNGREVGARGLERALDLDRIVGRDAAFEPVVGRDAHGNR